MPNDEMANNLFGMTTVMNANKKRSYSKSTNYWLNQQNVDNLVEATAVQISGPTAARLKLLLSKNWQDRYSENIKTED